jgi:cell division protein FtsI/penicillin-binding protein 2
MVQGNPRLRWPLIWVLATLWMLAIVGRLGYLQLVHYSDYLAKAQRQQQRVFEISPMRGTIYDRKGRELAVSLPMDSVFADPAEATDPAMVAQLLARPLQASADDSRGAYAGAPRQEAFSRTGAAHRRHELARRFLSKREPARLSAA